jgi:hypothetical protein
MDYKFNKEDIVEFKRFWESETGKKYLKKIEGTKEQLLDASMGSVDKDYVYRSTAIANGIHSIILDIKAIISGSKEEETAKKK